MPDRGTEHTHPITFAATWQAGPFRVVFPAQKALGVRHQAKDAARAIAESGDIIRTIKIIIVVIGQSDLIFFGQLGPCFGRGEQATFGVGDRQFNWLAVGNPGTARVIASQTDQRSVYKPEVLSVNVTCCSRTPSTAGNRPLLTKT